MAKDIVQLRTIQFKGIVYLQVEDVCTYIKEIASTEDTDVRVRLNEAIANLNKKPM